MRFEVKEPERYFDEGRREWCWSFPMLRAHLERGERATARRLDIPLCTTSPGTVEKAKGIARDWLAKGPSDR